MLSLNERRFNWPIIGHHNGQNFLQNSLISGNINQAYIFSGPEHIGKTTTVNNFVKSLLCENLHKPGGVVPCNECSCCKQINVGIHPDVFNVKLECNEKSGKLNKNISLEQIKELQNKLSRYSFLNSYKVAVIYNAEVLSEKAFNALLKTLEEPTPKTVLILLVNQIDTIPLTVISRCQVIKFLAVRNSEILNYLIKLGVEKKLAGQLAALSGGCPGIAINFYEDEDLFENYKRQAEEFINLTYQRIDERLGLANSLVSQQNDFSELVNNLKEILDIWRGIARDVMLINNSGGHFIKNTFLKQKLERLADYYSGGLVMKIIERIDQSLEYLQANVNPKLVIENLVINI